MTKTALLVALIVFSLGNHQKHNKSLFHFIYKLTMYSIIFQKPPADFRQVFRHEL